MLNVKLKPSLFFCCRALAKATASAAFSAMLLACAQSPQLKTDTDHSKQKIVVDRPIIKTLDSIHGDLKHLKNALVRLSVTNENVTSYGTGFFYRTNDLLITSQHLFNEKHECLTSKKCSITLGFAKNSKELTEQQNSVEVVLQNTQKDLIFLKITDTTNLAHVTPIKEIAKNHDGLLTAAGFFQDQPVLTFSQGKTLTQDQLNLSASNEFTTQSSIIVSSGFSGSPIVDKNGHLVGMVSSYRPLKGQPIGLAQFINADNNSNPF